MYGDPARSVVAAPGNGSIASDDAVLRNASYVMGRLAADGSLAML
jgi:hypothetical protein